MSHSRTLSIGVEVPQESMAGASVATAHDAEVIDLGTIGTRPGDRDQRLRQMPSTAQPLVVVSDAGPCGSWLSRSLTQQNRRCWVVAPSWMPQKAGDHVQTDRREAGQRARLMRAGALTRVDGPTLDDDAIRELTRAREATLRDLQAAPFRLNALLRRHESRSTGHATWGPAQRRWLSEVVGATPAHQRVFPAYVRAVHAPTERLQRLEQALQAPGKTGRPPPVVEALGGLRGVPCTVAVTIVAERGALTRFEHPRHVRTSLGLIPSDDSRGERRRQGAITTAGTAPARRALGEGAWASRSPATVSRHWHRRRETLPTPSPDRSWTAHVRRGTRLRRLMARGTHPNPGGVAMARDRAGLLWAMATEVPLIPSPPRPDWPCTAPHRAINPPSEEAQPR
jgi:transposase